MGSSYLECEIRRFYEPISVPRIAWWNPAGGFGGSAKEKRKAPEKVDA
jgi:hypothetical protein